MHPVFQHALVESQAVESDLQQGAAALKVSTSFTDSADTSQNLQVYYHKEVA